MPRTVEYTFNPFELVDVSIKGTTKKRQALREVAEFLREATIEDMDRSTSSVDGHGSFQSLSPEYRKKKQAAGKGGRANLEFDGDLKHAIKATVPDDNTVKIKVSGVQGDKAGGHCQHPGDEHPFLPIRRFIPAADETFRPGIRSGIKRILKEYED